MEQVEFIQKIFLSIWSILFPWSAKTKYLLLNIHVLDLLIIIFSKNILHLLSTFPCAKIFSFKISYLILTTTPGGAISSFPLIQWNPQ